MTARPAPPIARRTAAMTPIGVERMGDQADALQDPSMLRLENLDTDLLPPAPALQASLAAVHDDDANSYLPFFGHDRLRRAATALVERNARLNEGSYDWRRQCFVSRRWLERRAQRTAGPDRPGRRGGADEPDLRRPDQPRAPGWRRAAFHPAGAERRPAGVST